VARQKKVSTSDRALFIGFLHITTSAPDTMATSATMAKKKVSIAAPLFLF
jgi:hypothetical protein